MSLSELEQEKTALMREIKRLRNSSNDGYSKANIVPLEKRLRWTNEEIARRPKPKNQVPENRADDALAREKQERADRIRLEEQRLKQRAYEAEMVRTQSYYDNLKANAAYHASAEGVAVASAVVDPSRYMNPGQVNYIPSETPRVQSPNRRVVRQRLQHLRSVQYADIDENEEGVENEEPEPEIHDENGLARLEQLVNECWTKFWKGLQTSIIQYGYGRIYAIAPNYYKNGWENWEMSRDIVSYQRLLTDSNYRKRIMNHATDPRAQSADWYFGDWYRSGYKSLERINVRIGNPVPSQYSPLNRVNSMNRKIKKEALAKTKDYIETKVVN